MAVANERKKAGRQKNTPLEKIGPEFLNKTPQDMIDAEANANSLLIQHEQNLAVVDKTYGGDLPYDRTRLENEAQFYLRESATAMLEAGTRLIVIKEHEGHGNFTDSLERIGIGERAARKMMQAAVKFSKRPTLAVLEKSKLLELMVEDDDDLDALAEGGTLAGLKLDDVEKMSVRELKAALRKEREKRKEEADAHETLLEKKDQKINQLDREFLERSKRVKTWAGVVSEINLNLTNMSGEVIMHLSHLDTQVSQILEEMERFDLSEEESAAIVEPFASHIQTMFEYLNSLSASFNNNLSGYLRVHDTPYVSLNDLESQSDNGAAN